MGEKNTKAWFGNQYYDSKKKKWRDGKRPKLIHLGHSNLLWGIVIFVITSLIITLAINYFYPGFRIVIFG